MTWDISCIQWTIEYIDWALQATLNENASRFKHRQNIRCVSSNVPLRLSAQLCPLGNHSAHAYRKP